MDVTVRCVSEAAEEELCSLSAWLVADRATRRVVRSELGSALSPAPGSQGNGIDILSLVLSSGFSAGSLAVAVATWRATRPQPPTLVIERPDGTKVEITGHSPEEAERLMRRLLAD